MTAAANAPRYVQLAAFVAAAVVAAAVVAAARRLDRMRRACVADAAHEARTPLTTVSGMASLLATPRFAVRLREAS